MLPIPISHKIFHKLLGELELVVGNLFTQETFTVKSMIDIKSLVDSPK